MILEKTISNINDAEPGSVPDGEPHLDSAPHSFYSQFCKRLSVSAEIIREFHKKIFNNEKLKMFFYLVMLVFIFALANKAHYLSGHFYLSKWFEKNNPSPLVWKKMFLSYDFSDVTQSERFIKAIRNIPFHENDAHGIWISQKAGMAIVLWKENQSEAEKQGYQQGIGIYSLHEKPAIEWNKYDEVDWTSYAYTWKSLAEIAELIEFSEEFKSTYSRPVALKNKKNTPWRDPREIFY